MGCLEHIGFYKNAVDFPKHQHMSCEINFVRSGTIEIESGECRIVVTDNMICFVPSCVEHKTSVKSAVYERTLIFINPWILSRKFYSDDIYGFIMGMSCKLPIAIAADDRCLSLIDEISRESANSTGLSDDIISADISRLIAEIIRKSNLGGFSPDSANKVVSDVQIYIQENFRQPLKISEIADRFYISKFYLTHIFKEQTGMSPRQFLTFTRISRAYRLLHSKEISVSQISDLCGFASPSDMSKKFRAQYGMSPTEFRKQME